MPQCCDEAPPPDWMEIDSKASYDLAIKVIGERVKAGAPVPEFMLSEKDVAK